MIVVSTGITNTDKKYVEEILRSTDFFYDFEIQTALEIAEETIIKGSEKSGYFWMKLCDSEGMVAFGNFGKNSFSTQSWDLYWLAVHQNRRNQKLGTLLLKSIEDFIRHAGGKILWIETSGRPLYASTEGFYKNNGYALQASLKDFYSPGDPKQIYSKIL